jgi:hypothetical protein
MPVNFQKLGAALAAENLTGKPVNNYTPEEVEKLVHACVDALIPDMGAKFTKPYITDDGDLIVPHDSDPKYHFWHPCGQSIFHTLRELGANEEVWRKYVTTPDEPF